MWNTSRACCLFPASIGSIGIFHYSDTEKFQECYTELSAEWSGAFPASLWRAVRVKTCPDISILSVSAHWAIYPCGEGFAQLSGLDHIKLHIITHQCYRFVGTHRRCVLGIRFGVAVLFLRWQDVCCCRLFRYVPALRQLRQVAFVVPFPSTVAGRLACRLHEVACRFFVTFIDHDIAWRR